MRSEVDHCALNYTVLLFLEAIASEDSEYVVDDRFILTMHHSPVHDVHPLAFPRVALCCLERKESLLP